MIFTQRFLFVPSLDVFREEGRIHTKLRSEENWLSDPPNFPSFKVCRCARYVKHFSADLQQRKTRKHLCNFTVFTMRPGNINRERLFYLPNFQFANVDSLSLI